ncbi:DUF2254 domain-containing protein [Thioalkalivibrio sp. ALMg11]|uniref:DUF2254 domain-containing protein n=1 Tax=Thioalkalivibrio sp. ALMg11 TaxID=1158165 RepID=UPI00037F1312|nr:DUF2254 domain-containing protein [Thioalkalivibrio sp. ALMg11]
MKTLTFRYWDRIRSSLWFIPTVMALGAVFLAFISVALDRPVTNWLLRSWGWTFTAGAEGASAVLGIIAGSMITIAGVVFSMTLVALSLATSQLGPRLLRNFLRDTTTQVVLGTFVATFLYCLLVLLTIRRAEEVAFVPHVSITLGVLFAVASVGVLIYFIHHVSVSMQANEIVARVSEELIAGVDRLFPEHIGRGTSRTSATPPESAFLDAFDREARPIPASADGYIQFIDTDALIELAMQKDVVIRLERVPGDYVVSGGPLILVWPGERATDVPADQVNNTFALGNQRTSGQDIEFAVTQLVEVALRALSSGVNDPFTAITCVDHLASALSRLATRDMPSPYRFDSTDQLRVIAPGSTFVDVTDAAFNQIRQMSRSNTAVTVRLLETIAEVARFVQRPEDRAALLRHAEMIARGASEGQPEVEDRQKVEERFQFAKQLLSVSPRTGSDHDNGLS